MRRRRRGDGKEEENEKEAGVSRGRAWPCELHGW